MVAGTGAAVGVFAALTGLAGSLIALPALHTFSGLSTHVVTGTVRPCRRPCPLLLPPQTHGASQVLAATTVSAGATAAAYAAQGVTNFQACAALASTGVFTAALGSVLTRHVQPGPLKRITGVALICIAPVIFMPGVARLVNHSSDSCRNSC